MTRLLLEELFGSRTRPRTLRFFIRNPKGVFPLREVARRLKISPRILKHEVGGLRRTGFLKETSLKTGKRRKVRAWKLDTSFEFLDELTPLVLKPSGDFYGRLERDIKRLGSVRLAIVSGVFADTSKAKADLFIVMSKIPTKRVNSFIQNLEAEIGQELTCAVVDLKEFEYRMKLYDRFVRDMLDRKNRRLVDRIGRLR